MKIVIVLGRNEQRLVFIIFPLLTTSSTGEEDAFHRVPLLVLGGGPLCRNLAFSVPFLFCSVLCLFSVVLGFLTLEVTLKLMYAPS